MHVDMPRWKCCSIRDAAQHNMTSFVNLIAIVATLIDCLSMACCTNTLCFESNQANPLAAPSGKSGRMRKAGNPHPSTSEYPRWQRSPASSSSSSRQHGCFTSKYLVGGLSLHPSCLAVLQRPGSRVCSPRPVGSEQQQSPPIQSPELQTDMASSCSGGMCTATRITTAAIAAAEATYLGCNARWVPHQMVPEDAHCGPHEG
jgi:hypothetical protein